MGTQVLQQNEILLNGIRYKTTGRVRPVLASTLPEKLVLGDYTKDTERRLSSWVMSDYRGGILKEKIVEPADYNRAWWSTCNLDYLGHILLPPLVTQATLPTIPAATLTDGGLEVWTDANTLTNWTKSAVGTWLTQNSVAANKIEGQYSAEFDDATKYIYQDISWNTAYQGKKFTLKAWSKDVNGRLRINDGIGETTATGTGYQAVTRTLAPNATRLRLILFPSAINTFMDDATLISPSLTSPKDFCHYANNLYLASGNCLLQLDKIIGSQYQYIATFPANITKLVATVNDTMLVLLGEDDEYWYVNNNLIHDCESLWSALPATGVTVSKDTSDYKVGSASVQLDVADSVAAGTTLWSHVLASTDLSNAVCIVLFIKSSVTAAAGDLQFYLTETVDVSTFDLPALTTNTWTSVVLPITSIYTAANLNAVIGFGITMVNDLGACSINIDEIRYINCIETNVSSSVLGIHWNARANKIDENGQLTYTATPNSATPTWTNNGKLDFIDTNSVNNLLVYRNYNAVPIIYAGTKTGLWSHDSATGTWLETELKMPAHDDGGKGLAKWRESLFISAGLELVQYLAGTTASIKPMGLNSDDGLPSTYKGTIIKLIDEYNDLYVAVDSASSGVTSYSALYKWDNRGWQCRWASASANQIMRTGIVSSIYDYRLWFDHNNNIYYQKLAKDLRNPLQVSGSEFATSGIHITPWFDASWMRAKTATKLVVRTRGCSATETVVVKYRLNYSNHDVATGWTTLGTITTDGTTEYSLVSGAGLEFTSIQFRFDLARGTTVTLSPDIEFVVLYYLKRTTPSWSWIATLDLQNTYDDRSPSDLYTQLLAALNSATLLTFVFKDIPSGETENIHYVQVSQISGSALTGTDRRGIYEVELVEFK